MGNVNTTVTLAHVARMAGVSKMTVSNVINNKPGMSEDTRQRVLDAIEQSGYVANSAARALAGQSMNLIGVIAPQLDSSYLTEILHGASTAAEAAGFDLAIFTTSNNIKRERERATLLRSFADGVLLVMPVADEHQIFLGAVPVVTINADRPYTVQSDNTSGGRLVAQHLLDLGHRRIGIVRFPLETKVRQRNTLYVPREDVLERQRSFLQTLLDAGVSVKDEYRIESDLSDIHAEAPALALLTLPEPPTAIFAINDELAVGVLRAAQTLGLRVPEDLSVIGFDDVPLAQSIRPALTTIQQPLRAMGAAAIQMLSDLSRGITPDEPHPCFPTSLIVRDSTAPSTTAPSTTETHARSRIQSNHERSTVLEP
jgi:LacI family transcriptional regulator